MNTSDSPRGLSPQVRGTHFSARHLRELMRFIPAGAGNTRGTPALEWAAPVYPRRCGEHFWHGAWDHPWGGLSPQVRGTPVVASRRPAAPRFIPAGAGNTDIITVSGRSKTVYPRRCGEHSGTDETRSSETGLSPQVRGTRTFNQPFCATNRFIPAGAGNTRFRYSWGLLRAVYPRRCGEHVRRRRADVNLHGLSPQVRGTL